MSVDPVRQIADAVLYEGYILWPYRRSALKNRQRWTFGGVYPRAHGEGREDDPWELRTEVLVEGDAPCVDVSVRFLQVVRRQVFRGGQAVDSLEVGGKRVLSWDEAVEREAAVGSSQLAALGSWRSAIRVEAGSRVDALGADAAVVRSWHELRGGVEVVVAELRPGLARVSVRVANETPFDGGAREAAVERAFNSCHAVLRVEGGSFVSLTDPPEELRDEARACRNEGVWPVLVGEPGERGTVLASPIILEDHPRIAPESPGDLFDGGEIDQLLVLNILGMTDDEKAEMRASDPRAREILERTESLTPAQLMRLHGTIRDLRRVGG